jgi:hypothetical protein
VLDKTKDANSIVHFSRTILSTLVATGAHLALEAGAAPAFASEWVTNLGPVGPREPILVNLGDQRIVAFFVPERGGCAVNAVTWKDTGPDAPHASARVRITLKPGQIVQIDGAQPHAMGLLCGPDASSLATTASAELIVAGKVEKD